MQNSSLTKSLFTLIIRARADGFYFTAEKLIQALDQLDAEYDDKRKIQVFSKSV